MSSHWNRAARMSRTIHCAVIQAHPLSHSPRENAAGGFRDLVPWADPYIAALIEKLRRSATLGVCDDEVVGELPPPLDSDDAGADDGWPGSWSPRNWPHE